MIREVHGLRARRAAAAPRSRPGRKWEAVARQPRRPHYLVCNADESEPGTFKDRVLHGGRPVRAGRGDDHRRASPPAASAATSTSAASTRWRSARLAARASSRRASAASSAPTSSGEGFAFDIELRSGAGAYICGEETALFNSIEGYRGEPRNKPPFPVEGGLFGQPTVVNNVETLVNVLPIVLEGGAGVRGDRHRALDRAEAVLRLRARSRGPGVYEVPFGTTLRELLELAGGVRGGRTLRAVLLGGAAGSVRRRPTSSTCR